MLLIFNLCRSFSSLLNFFYCITNNFPHCLVTSVKSEVPPLVSRTIVSVPLVDVTALIPLVVSRGLMRL